MSKRRHDGQAAVEVVGVALALGIALLVGWQALVAAHTWQAAQSAARSAARAGSVGAPVARAALTVLPDRLAKRARVHTGSGTIEVRVAIPSVVPWIDSLGSVSGAAGVVR